MYPYGVIGNCSVVALINISGSLDWLCFPNPDSPPLFGRLLDPAGGHCALGTSEPTVTRQRYIEYTNILETEVESAQGAFRITDFSPRFAKDGRTYRPRQICRRLEPIRGAPLVSVVCKPVAGWEREYLRPYIGAHAIHYEFGGGEAALTTTISPEEVVSEAVHPLTQTEYFVLGHGSEQIGDVAQYVEEALRATSLGWHAWVQHLQLPAVHATQAIRSALALKLNCIEESGAILAAPTTSLPEIFGGERNWDYRFCWLRDAAFVLAAFDRLGQTEEIRQFLRFLLEIATDSKELHPVYRANHTLPLPEEVHLGWRGFRDSRPVRSNNQAGEHVQNDVYGEMLLSLGPIFSAERYGEFRSATLIDLVEFLSRKAAEAIGAKDAGLWEFRSMQQVHSFSALASWAGLRGVAEAQQQGSLTEVRYDIRGAMQRATEVISAAIVDGTVRNGPHDPSFDAALLLLPIFHYPDRALNESTVRAIHRALAVNREDPQSPHIYRYRRADDFGIPQGSFVICSYWLIEALARLGHQEEAHRMLLEMDRCANHLGLIAEHIEPRGYKQSGNFPQAYSHVGLINAAFAVGVPPAHSR
jgi:GH15 family glucan-1,4-alpha-glucosidase